MLAPETRDCLKHVIARQGPYVKYRKIGGRMGHWRAAHPIGKADKTERNIFPILAEIVVDISDRKC